MRALIGLLGLALALLIASPSEAQTGTPANTVSACGTPNNTPVVGNYYSITMDTHGVLCTPGGSSASPVTVTPQGVTSTDAGALTITLGGTYQTVFAANASRKSCLIQNPVTATEVLSIKLGAQASVYQVPAGATFSCANVDGTVVQDAILMTAATTAHAFAAVTQ